VAKNIILLADGTGNGAASAFKTNVWRLYQALDLTTSDQVALYDDGVGTETFKPLAALGGAFGFGVWKNVRNLYTFLCRNHTDPLDRIYLFGFSRGAFTVRLLAGLIMKCGVVRWTTEAELRRNVAAAFSAYRRDFLYRATSSPARRTMRLWLHRLIKCQPHAADHPLQIALGDDIEQRRVQIQFLGVWDTVDAYGMPVDEWKRGIDQVVWPMSFADRYFSFGIVKARHALSLDDERSTFRPVLWNEFDFNGQQISRERLLQVWFSGVHANVGGGYPDDSLSYVPLYWMMLEVSPTLPRRIAQPNLPSPPDELNFIVDAAAAVRDGANVDGRQYDSRAGLAGYYRYGPRSVPELCDDSAHLVKITDPVLHRSVIERVSAGSVPCAPISAPRQFSVAQTGQNGLGTGQPIDMNWMELAWDRAWWRLVFYLATVVLTVLLASFPILQALGWLDRVDRFFTAHVCALAPGACTSFKSLLAAGYAFVGQHLPTLISVSIPELIIKVAPSWSVIWVKSFVAYPIIALALLLPLAWLFFIGSRRMQNAIADYAEFAWWEQKHGSPPPAARGTFLDAVARFMRKRLRLLHRASVGVVQWLFGAFTALIIVTLAIATFPFSLYAVYRFWRFLRGTDVSTGGIGRPTPDPAVVSAPAARETEEDDTDTKALA
jgi:hypothetical protein